MADYEKDYAQVGAVLAAQGVPYRIDEMNSCYNGGAKDSSDTYASTLWALDCTHWWAAHHILGMNYHTGESVGRDGGFGAAELRRVSCIRRTAMDLPCGRKPMPIWLSARARMDDRSE